MLGLGLHICFGQSLGATSVCGVCYICDFFDHLFFMVWIFFVWPNFFSYFLHLRIVKICPMRILGHIYMEFMNGISIRVILEHNGIEFFCQELILYHFSLNEYDNVIIIHLFYSSEATVMSLQIYKLKLTIVNTITYDRHVPYMCGTSFLPSYPLSLKP
jgi:hypothetical protein